MKTARRRFFYSGLYEDIREAIENIFVPARKCLF